MGEERRIEKVARIVADFCQELTIFVPPPPRRVPVGSKHVDAFGLGTLPLGVLYPDASRRPDRARAMAIVRTAARLGAELYDTADSYGADDKDFGYVEKLLHEALRGGGKGRGGEEEQRVGGEERGEGREACVATKGGMLRVSREANGWRPSRCDREYLLTRMRSSWENLGGRDPVFLWQLHHPNEKESPIEEAMQAAKTAQERGWVQHVGLCNVTLDQLRRARRVVEVAAVQCELNYWTRKVEKQGMLDYCRDNRIAFIAFGALGGLKCRRGER